MKVLIMGAGYVGLATALAVLENGHRVDVVDTDSKKLSDLSQGRIPFFEADLSDGLRNFLLTENLSYKQTQKSYEAVMICVGTPSLQSGAIDLSQVTAAVERAKELLAPDGIIVMKSTVLPGTTQTFQNSNPTVNFAMVPEFLREGTAVSDALHPDRIIFGVQKEECIHKLRSLLNPKNEWNEIRTNITTAEVSKYLSNSFFAMLIFFANYWDEVAHKVGSVEVDQAFDSLFLDRRFGNSDALSLGLINYLVPGIGFGGSCFPKDLRAMEYFVRDFGFETNLFKEILESNEGRVQKSAARILQNTRSQTFLIAGLSFKEGTSDLRESPALKLFNILRNTDISTYWYDNFVLDSDITERLMPWRVTNLGKFVMEHKSIEILLTNHDSEIKLAMINLAKDCSWVKLTGLRGQLNE